MKKLFTIISLFVVMTAQAQTVDKCKALTKAGKPCRNTAVINGYCRLHNPLAFRCGYLKADKKPCMNRVKTEGDRCRFHKDSKPQATGL